MQLKKEFVVGMSLVVLGVLVISACGRYAPVSRRSGETCDFSTDCEGDLYCNSHGICAGGSSGGSSSSSGGGSSSSSSSSACSPTCSSGSTCVTNASSGPTCLEKCTSDNDCAYCCVPLTNGGSVCADDSSFCQSSPTECPSGTFRETQGGPCVSEPSDCPNSWTVCNCPDFHGAWCHPGCGDPGSPGTYCSGASC